jgi:hypothetical protein
MKWNEVSAINCLERNGIKVGTKTFKLDRQPGIKLWGVIDYLVNHCGYIHPFLTK